jgi:energy-coupling factor transport system permease protein
MFCRWPRLKKSSVSVSISVDLSGISIVSQFSPFGSLTIGQYLPLGSPVHRLDPRAKIVIFIALVALVAFADSYLASLVLLSLLLGVVKISRTPLRFALQGLRPALPWIALFAFLQLLFYRGQYTPDACQQLWSWGVLTITTCGIRQIGLMALRLLEFMLLTSMLTLTTSTTELTHGLESLLAPLKRLRFPAHELALVFAIALRFAPTLAGELERLTKAQASRGADFGEQGRMRFVQRTRNLLPLLVPLFLCALRRAEDLTLAMEARGYTGGRGRTSLIELKASPTDYVAVTLVLLFCLSILAANFGATEGLIAASVTDWAKGVFGLLAH